ncbi:MAG: hypothetical protein Q9227_005624 [Pyrenula ochraceoflavens]
MAISILLTALLGVWHFGDALPQASQTSADPSAPTAVTRNGTYQGSYSSSYNQDFFLGIPYAQPPVGNNRFSIPQSLNSTFSDVKPARQYYPACVGYGGDQIGYAESEDCLALNVVRPAGYEDQELPIALWIHGGGLQMGSAVDRRYNLSFIVQNSVSIGKPIIGVSIQYRLGPWGFLYSQEIQSEGQTNLGLRDQRLALQWIQENIASFGGDPTKVAIWGESAGALSVGLHLVAYGGRDDKLFRAGIMESGNPVNYNAFQNVSFYQPLYDAISQSTGCSNSTDSLNCLRYVPFDQLNAVFNTSAYNGTDGKFNPIIDGDWIQNYTSLQLSSGAFVHVPIISGANTDEGTSFGPRGVQNETAFLDYLTSPDDATGAVLPSSFAEQILSAYPDDPSVGIPAELGSQRLNSTYGYEYRRTSAYAGDAVFIANRRLTCETWASASVPAYCYRFNTVPNGVGFPAFVTHFQEVAFVFNNVDGLGYAINPFGGEPQSYFDLSKLMSCTWASFVHDLDPNSFRNASGAGAQIAGSSAEWPAYSAGAENIVWDANVTQLAYTEPDTFRSAGIDLINQGSLVYQR